VRGGELGAHIGYAPVYKNPPDMEEGRESNLESRGSGEIGLIMLDFEWNHMLNSKGYAELSKAMYDRKMWDGEFLGGEAPTLRTVVSIAMEIVGKVPGLGLLMYADDLLFAGLDLTGGYKDIKEVGLSLAKTAATAGIKAGAGVLFNGIGTVEDQALAAANGGGFFATGGINNWIGETFSGWGRVAMSTLSAGAQTALTTTSNLAVNSFEIRDGGLRFNGEGFTSSLTSMTTWASTAAAATAAFTGGAMGQVNLKDGNGIVLNGHTFDTNAIQKLNNFTGSLAGTGVSYAMTGEAAFNVLNLKDFTGNDKQALGLFELHLGGDNGFSMNLGTEGTDLSYSTVAGAMAGVRDSGKIIGAKLNALGGNMEGISTLNAVNMMGWTDDGLNQKIAKSIWEDELNVAYEDIGEEYGEYKIGNGVVTIRETLLGGGKEGSAKLAAVLAHEGTHAEGNRIEGIAHLQGNWTYGAINEIFGLEGDGAFSAQMISAILNPESWKENTGDTDYWKVIVKADGSYKMQDDGKDDITVENEAGDKLAFFAYTGDSRTKFIAETLGISQGEVNTAMGSWSGWTYENGTWKNNNIGDVAVDGTIVDGVVRFGDEISERISFPLDTDQKSLVQEIIGMDFNGNVFDYSGVRISYRKTPEQTLRDEIARMSNASGAISGMLNGMTQSQIDTMIQDAVQSSRPFSLPNGVIYFPVEEYKVNTLDFNATMATLTHEIFHQFQYMDMGISNAFKELLTEQVLYDGGRGIDVYKYAIHNNVGGANQLISSLNDITYYEGKANFIEDFAGYYLRNKNSNPPLNYASNNNLINQRAAALSVSGLNSRAINYAKTWR
jgi:hypothetical protein